MLPKLLGILVFLLSSVTLSVFGQDWQVVWETSGSGIHWTTEIEFVDSLVGWAIVYRKWVLRTTDGGNTWAEAYQTTGELGRIEAFGPDSAWVLGNDQVYWTIDGGKSWTPRYLLQVPHPMEPPNQGAYPVGMWDLDCVDMDHCFAVGTAVYRTTTGPGGWEKVPRQPAQTPAAFFTMQMIDENEVWIAGGPSTEARGYAFQTVDGGETWDKVDARGKSWRKVHFFNQNDGYLASWDRGFMVTTDGGQSWVQRRESQFESVETPETGLWQAYFVDLDHGWFVGQRGLLEYTNDGWSTHTDMSRDDWGGVGDFTDPPYLEAFAIQPGRAIFVGGFGLDRSFKGFIQRLECTGATSQLPGCACECTDPVVCSAEETESIPRFDLSVETYPNPVSTSVRVEFTLPAVSRTEFRIVNVLGQNVVKATWEPIPAGRQTREVSLGDLPSGRYLYRLSTDHGSASGILTLMR